MAGPHPIPITVSPPQQAVLDGLLRQHSCPQALVLRVQIVLGAAAGQRNQAVARQLGCTPKTVWKWRGRWALAQARLAATEAEPQALRALIAAILADAPRPGAPDTFTAEQIVQILNLACTPPGDAGRPIDSWTPRDLADEARLRRIVTRISPQSVARFLKSSGAAATSQSLLAECEGQTG
jgi:Homeodomain-like domain